MAASNSNGGHVMAPLLTITDAQELQWRQQGYCIVDNPNFTVEGARREASFSTSSANHEFGSKDGSFEFPCGLPNVDDIPIRLQNVAQRLLRTDRVVLSQADVWIKTPKPQTELSNDDQRMHCDFGNNTVVPRRWDEPSALAAIVYFDGPEECGGGGTAVVARQGPHDAAFFREKMMVQPGYGGRPWLNNRTTAERWFLEHRPQEFQFREQLYKREKLCEPKVGRVLLYRLDIWHRGTPLVSGSRRVMNLVFIDPADPSFAGRWNPGFWKNSYWWVGGRYAPPDRVFCRMTPEQRMLIGYPPKTDTKYWNAELLALLELRFPQEFDSSPYREQLSASSLQQSKL